MIKIQMICMQWVKDGQCYGYSFASAKPHQLCKVIRGCKPRGQAGGQVRFAAHTLAAESSSQGISTSQPHQVFSRTSYERRNLAFPNFGRNILKIDAERVFPDI